MLAVQKSGRRLLFRLICVYGVQSLGMLVPMFKDEMAMLAESVLMEEGSMESGWERDRRRNTTKVQLAFCSKNHSFSH